MPEFDRSTLAIVDDIRDREQASDGHSRYGAYLAQHADDFHEDGAPLRPVEFAIAAWRTATAPVMAPGYVAVRPDVYPLDVYRDHHGNPGFCAKVGLRHGDLARRPDHRLRARDWERDPWGRHDDPFPVLISPERTDRPAVLVAATLLLPIPDDILLRPTAARPGRTLTHEAKQVVAALAAHANTHLSPLVDDLLGGAR
ncbi:hypothetical protein OG196_23510 [Kitasatospora purpeofusca]|uniref:hypothetical protein n=1 Tax=Kitasatospora purpeofusca TaxID=67352 RepID=UPI002E0F929C|nr:hypothetical protein OG196_23510 [Kitasatospora purpeofusca]